MSVPYTDGQPRSAVASEQTVILISCMKCVPEASPVVLRARGTAKPLGFRLSGPTKRAQDALALILLPLRSSFSRHMAVMIRRFCVFVIGNIGTYGSDRGFSPMVPVDDTKVLKPTLKIPLLEVGQTSHRMSDLDFDFFTP